MFPGIMPAILSLIWSIFVTLNRFTLQLNMRLFVWGMFLTLNRYALQLNML
jgi:hypothetical protein